MVDPFLFELLHRIDYSNKQNSNSEFDLALDESIREEAKIQLESIQDSGMISFREATNKAEEEIRQGSDLTDFGKNISLAITIFRKEGIRYLEKENYNHLISALQTINEKIKSLNLKDLKEELIKKALEISEEVAISILKIGVDKFEEGVYKDSLAVFSFLTLVCPDEPEYWYRMGHVAHLDNQLELSIKAFHAAATLDQDLVEPHIFSAECHLELKEYAEAAYEIQEAKKWLESHKEDLGWAENISILEQLLEEKENDKHQQ